MNIQYGSEIIYINLLSLYLIHSSMSLVLFAQMKMRQL